jgi:hypothetical protein
MKEKLPKSRRMALRCVALARTDVSEELSSDFVFLRSVRRLLVTANVPSPPILVTLMMEAKVLRNVDSYKSHTA